MVGNGARRAGASRGQGMAGAGNDVSVGNAGNAISACVAAWPLVCLLMGSRNLFRQSGGAGGTRNHASEVDGVACFQLHHRPTAES